MLLTLLSVCSKLFTVCVRRFLKYSPWSTQAYGDARLIRVFAVFYHNQLVYSRAESVVMVYIAVRFFRFTVKT